MPDGAHVEFAVEAAEESLDVGEVLVAAHHITAVEGLGGQAGAQHVDAVECGLGRNGLFVAGEAKRGRSSYVAAIGARAALARCG